jgi:hypothetical protein
LTVRHQTTWVNSLSDIYMAEPDKRTNLRYSKRYTKPN